MMRRVIVAAFCLLGVAAPAAAQETVSDVLGFLVTNQAVLTADFERDRAAAEAARGTISRALLINLTSVPLATSSSGFLYRLNPDLGTVERATESFGGFFVERALGAGRGRASFGVSGATSGFDKLGAQDLRDGTLITVANGFRDEPAPFDTESLTLKLRTHTTTLFGSVGLTDRLEIGGAIPFVSLRLEGQRVNVYRGSTFLQASGTAAATGIADIALRAKYTVAASRRGGVAAAAELRLPTGDEANLLGAGSMAYRLTGIGSYEEGRLGLHANAGIVRGGVSDELSAAAAASYAVRPRLTLSGEFLLRSLADLRDITLTPRPHPTIAGVDTLRLGTGTSGTTLSNAIAGFKWNVSGTLVIGGHVAWPLLRRGLTAPLTPSLALEYGF